jgi:CRP-like cAMP-binding protein
VSQAKPVVPIFELPIFKDFSKDQIQDLIRGGIAYTSKHREILFRAGDPATYMSLVLQGAYKLTRIDTNGNESIMYFASPGDAIGALVVPKPNAQFPVTCVSMGASMVLKIPRQTYLESWFSNAPLQQRINGILFQRMSRLHEEKMQQRLPLPIRVSAILVNLLEKYSNGADQIVPVPITRQEIADSAGAAVESVIRLMSEWTSEGLIKTEDRQIEVIQLDRLIAISNGE